MKKFLLPLLFLLNYSPSHASWLFDSTKEAPKQIPKKISELQKCIGATALLLGTLSGLDDIKDKDNTKTTFQGLQVLQKDLENRQVAKNLHDAIDKCDYKLARELLKDKPHLDINARFTEHKVTALMQCCDKGDKSINVVKEILKHPKLDITIKNSYGLNYLHCACIFGRPKITSLLLKREDIGNLLLNAKTNKGSTPLDCIFYKVKESKTEIGHITVWNMMIAKGAQLSKGKDTYGQLNSDKYKPPYSDYVDLIKSNPPKKVNIPKKSFSRQNMNSNQEGIVEDTKGYQHKDERKEEE